MAARGDEGGPAARGLAEGGGAQHRAAQVVRPRPGEVGRLSHALLPRARRAAGSGGDASGTLRARQGDAGLRRQGHRPQPGRRPAGLSHEGIEGGDGAMTATPPLTTPPLTTPLCRLLGCRYPILQAGMGGVARSALAAAVAEAGGYGFLGMVREAPALLADRKSTRLNSSH